MFRKIKRSWTISVWVVHYKGCILWSKVEERVGFMRGYKPHVLAKVSWKGGGFSAVAQAKKPKNGFIPCAYLNGTNHQMVQTYLWLTINRLLHCNTSAFIRSHQTRSGLIGNKRIFFNRQIFVFFQT